MSDDFGDDQIRAAFRELRDRHQPPPSPTDAIVGEAARRRNRRRLVVGAVAAGAVAALAVPVALVAGLGGGEGRFASDEQPAICRDVFFTSGEGDRYQGAYAVFGFDEHGTRREQLTDDHASEDGVVSPDGTRMVVVSGRGHQHHPEFGFEVTSLFVAGLDGSGERRLTTGHLDELPAWSPDGSRIAFVRRHERGDRILVIDVENPGRPTVVATFERGRPSYLAWLDDDTVTWWSGQAGGRSPLLGRAADGSGPIATVAPDVYSPVLSADRTAVAYTVTDRDGIQRIAVRDLDSGEVGLVDDSASSVTTPVAWTVDDRLFFTRNVEGPEVNLVVAEHGETEVVGQPDWEGYETVHLNPVCG